MVVNGSFWTFCFSSFFGLFLVNSFIYRLFRAFLFTILFRHFVICPIVQEGESCFKYADMRYRNLKTINAFFSTQILYDDKLKNLSKKRLNRLGRFSFFGHFVLKFWTFCFGDYNFIFFIKKTHQK